MFIQCKDKPVFFPICKKIITTKKDLQYLYIYELCVLVCGSEWIDMGNRNQLFMLNTLSVIQLHEKLL